MAVEAAQPGYITILQQAASSGNGNIVAVGILDDHSIEIEGSVGVVAGAIQIESSFDSNYTGTWNPVGSGPITVVASMKLLAQFSGSYIFLRGRISTAMSGGTVTVKYVGHH